MKTFNVYLDDVRPGPTVEYPDTHSQVPNKTWVIVRRTEYLKIMLEAGLVNDMDLDHDLGSDDETGYDLLAWCEKNNIWNKGIVSVHTGNPVGRQRMLALLAANGR
jgi:hypothetical protein